MVSFVQGEIRAQQIWRVAGLSESAEGELHRRGLRGQIDNNSNNGN